jgi:hypothetical protein
MDYHADGVRVHVRLPVADAKEKKPRKKG